MHRNDCVMFNIGYQVHNRSTMDFFSILWRRSFQVFEPLFRSKIKFKLCFSFFRPILLHTSGLSRIFYV